MLTFEWIFDDLPRRKTKLTSALYSPARTQVYMLSRLKEDLAQFPRRHEEGRGRDGGI